jgi:pimeloyl-ACP methyl ester carboxylesterase
MLLLFATKALFWFGIVWFGLYVLAIRWIMPMAMFPLANIPLWIKKLFMSHLIYDKTNNNDLPKGWEEINYKVQDGNQVAYYKQGTDKDETLWVYFHGNACYGRNMTYLFENVKRHVLIFEYPGYGPCTGSCTKAELTASLKTLVNLPRFRGRQLRFIGYSIGGAVAAYLANQISNVRQLMLVSTLSSTEDIIRDTFTMYSTPIYLPFLNELIPYNSSFNTTREIQNFIINYSHTDHAASIKGPVVVYHGTDDTILPITLTRPWAKNLDVSYHELYDHNHHSTMRLDLVREMMQ